MTISIAKTNGKIVTHICYNKFSIILKHNDKAYSDVMAVLFN